MIDACASWEIGEAYGGYTIRCAMVVDAETGGGDSGSPVFKVVPGTDSADVRIRGLVFSGDGCNGQMYDPAFPYVVLVCEEFVAANLGGVNADIGYLQYYTSPPPPPPMTVTINGPGTWPPYQTVTVQASVSGGTPPYTTFAWQVNGAPYCQNQSWCDKTMGPPGTSVFFYLTVTDSHQSHASNYKTVVAQY